MGYSTKLLNKHWRWSFLPCAAVEVCCVWTRHAAADQPALGMGAGEGEACGIRTRPGGHRLSYARPRTARQGRTFGRKRISLED